MGVPVASLWRKRYRWPICPLRVSSQSEPLPTFAAQSQINLTFSTLPEFLR